MERNGRHQACRKRDDGSDRRRSLSARISTWGSLGWKGKGKITASLNMRALCNVYSISSLDEMTHSGWSRLWCV